MQDIEMQDIEIQIVQTTVPQSKNNVISDKCDEE